MKKYLFLGPIMAIMFAIPFSASAQVPFWFGGVIVDEALCGDSGVFLIVAQPAPLPPIPIMWLYGQNLEYPEHIPPHPGQVLLGLTTGEVPIPCFNGPFPVTLGVPPVSAGFPILYYGSYL